MAGKTSPDTQPAPKKRGRPTLASGEGKTAGFLLRTTPELAARAQQMADAAGMSRNAWIEQLIRRAKA